VGWLGDLVDSAGTATAALSGAAVLAAVLTWLVAVLFAGGALTMLDEHWENFSFTLFCSGAGEHFWRILRLSLFGLACYCLAWGAGKLPALLARKIYGEGMEAWPIAVAGIVGSVLTVLLLGWVATVLDYAKVRLVSGRTRGAFKALLRSFVFVFRHFATIMGVWLMNALLFALLGVLYLQISNGMHASTTATILLLLCVQQVFILFRTAQRVAAWGAALEIYRAFWPPMYPPFEPELVSSLTGGGPKVLRASAEAEPEPPASEDTDL
jgi:hypothetical protein